MVAPNNTETVIEMALRFRAAIEAKDTAAVNRMIKAYQGLFTRLEPQIEALTLQIASGEYTRTQVIHLERYKAFLAQTAEELRDFQGLTKTELETLGRLGVQLGEQNGRILLESMVVGQNATGAMFQRLPTDAIEQLLGFLDPQGPLYERLSNLATVTTAQVEEAILDGFAKGIGSQRMATEIVNALGIGLTDAMRMARTVSNYAYRESSRAVYAANAEVLDGWQWFAVLDGMVCMSCVAQHGTIHPVTETLNDHHNGRCTMIPVVKGFDPVVSETAGKDWFDQQPESVQKQMMGGAKWQAWRDGKFGLSDITGQYHDDVYGDMKRAKSLKELIGDDR
jgi:hypothetical protein